MSILGLSLHTNPGPPATPSPIQRRLAEAFVFVEHLQQQRLQGQDAMLGRFIEERLIWRELLDLELQDIDEQIEGICASAAVPEKERPDD